MRTHIRIACVIALAAAAAACDESLSTLAGPTPNLEVTFTSIQRDIFQTTDSAGRAGCTNCHNATGSRFNGLNLESAAAYDQLVNFASVQQPSVRRVVPGDPDASYLIRKIEGTGGITGRRMPLNGPPFLTSGQIQIIRRWIEEGAPRN